METIKEKILRRRRQMVVHSIIYYRFNNNIIPDTTFDRWATELKELQEKYPQASQEVPYYKIFKNWDGSTGFHLCNEIYKEDYYSIAKHLLEARQKKINKITP